MFEQYTLPNGLRVVAEFIPHLRSVSAGLWVGAGSMHELSRENGLSHFLEHMLFKGTAKRTARAIAEEMDGIGGQINAFTSKECTCYYAKVMDEHLGVAVDVLSDLLLHSTLDAAELEKERGVILEEIGMAEDTPEDLVHELLTGAVLDGSSLAQPILGPADAIRSYQREDLVRYRDTHYRVDNTVLAIAGKYEPSHLRDLAESCLGELRPAPKPEQPPQTEAFSPVITRKDKDIEQVHVCMGYPGIALGNPDLYALSVFGNLFGGGMSSRLFQRIREESGMAYAVYGYPSVYPGCGLYTLYAGTSHAHLQAVLGQLREEVDKVLHHGVTAAEFTKAREQLKGNFILGLESPSSRMSSIGRNMLLRDRIYHEEEVLKKIANVTQEDVERVARDILSKPCGFSLVGREVEKVPESWLK